MRLEATWTLLLAGFVASPALAQPVKATHSAELTDPAGDVTPGSTSSGQRAPYDVVKLWIKSDGTDLSVGAAIKDPFGTFATSVVQVYIDVDNKPATGVETFGLKKPGFEYVSELDLCIEYDNGAKACSGGLSGKVKVKGYYAVAELARLGTSSTDKQSLKGPFEAPKSPVQGQTVEAKISYADLGVKPGQTIRLAVRESDSSYDEKGYFPDIVLTLK